MWSYVKGLLIGIFLLWLLLFISFAISDGAARASIFSVVLAKAVLGNFQKATGGKGIYITGFLILSIWVWSLGKKRRPEPAAYQSPNPDSLIQDSDQPANSAANIDKFKQESEPGK